MKIGDIVTETGTWRLRTPYVGELGIIVPLPGRLTGTQFEREANDGNIVWVHWTESGEDIWSFVSELEVVSENR